MIIDGRVVTADGDFVYTSVLPQPRSHYRTAYCSRCSHIRWQHAADGECEVCLKDSRYPCHHMVLFAKPVTPEKWTAAVAGARELWRALLAADDRYQRRLAVAANEEENITAWRGARFIGIPASPLLPGDTLTITTTMTIS